MSTYIYVSKGSEADYDEMSLLYDLYHIIITHCVIDAHILGTELTAATLKQSIVVIC